MALRTLPIRHAFALAAVVGACTLQGGLTTDLGDQDSAVEDPGGRSAGGSRLAVAGVGGVSSGGAASIASGGKLARGGKSGDGGVPTAGATSGGSGPIPVADAGDSAGGQASGGDEVVDFADAKNQYGFALSDSFFLTGCGEVQGAFDCVNLGGICPNQGAANFEDKGERFEESFVMRGDPGKTYLVTLAINGIVEAKYYQGGTRRAGNDFEADETLPRDMFYTGGQAIPSNYRTYKLSVFESDGVTPVEHYYLNSAPQSSGAESHRTFLISYQATIAVPGGGVIRYLNHDANCHTINNCGPGDIGTDVCPSPRLVPNDPQLVVPTMYGGRKVSEMNSVSGASQPYHAQIIHVRVTGVTLEP